VVQVGRALHQAEVQAAEVDRDTCCRRTDGDLLRACRVQHPELGREGHRNTIRIQEDYAFKEATSKAFQGYRDHMEHLANIEVEGANTALNLLSERTVEILAHEPLRIFSKTEGDASPSGELASLLNLRRNNPTKE
jgi:hypothetical protein